MVSCLLKRKAYISAVEGLKCRVHSSKGLMYTVQKETYFWNVDNFVKNEMFEYLDMNILQEYLYLCNEVIFASLRFTDFRKVDKWRNQIFAVLLPSR